MGVPVSLVSAGVRPRELGAELVRHVYRELNQEADALASGREVWDSQWTERMYEFCRFHFDGSFLQDRGA